MSKTTTYIAGGAFVAAGVLVAAVVTGFVRSALASVSLFQK